MERKIGLFSRARLFERFVAPRVPVHGIVGVLQQVGTLLVDEAIGMHCVFYYALTLRGAVEK